MTDLLMLLSFGDSGWGDELLKGLGVTLSLALITAPFALIFAFLIGWSKSSSNWFLRYFGNSFTTLFRSLPEILTILIIYYQLQDVVNYLISIVSPGTVVNVSPFFAGAFALTLVFSALGSAVVLSAYRVVGKGQFEAASSIGLSTKKAFFLVMLPQMWRHMLPAFGNLWLILLKDTSLVSVIALSDIVRYSNMAIATTKEPFFFYTVIAIIYVILALISGKIQMALERKFNQNLNGGR